MNCAVFCEEQADSDDWLSDEAIEPKKDFKLFKLAFAKKLEKEGRVLIVAPDDISGVDTLKLNKEALERLYERGYRDASPIPDFLVLRD